MYYGLSQDAFFEMQDSLEADMTLMAEMANRFRQQDTSFAKLLTPEQLRENKELYETVKGYKESYQKDNELLEQLQKGKSIAASYESYYSTEGFVDFVKKMFAALVKHLRAFVKKFIGPTAGVKQANQSFRKHVETKTMNMKNIAERAESLEKEGKKDLHSYLNLNAIYYLLGDDVDNVKKVLTDPDKIVSYVDDLVVRVDTMERQFERYKDILKDIAVLIYHCEKYDGVENVNDENIQKSLHKLDVIYRKIKDWIDNAEGVKEEGKGVYRIPEVRRNGGFLVEIDYRNGYPFYKFTADREKNSDVKEKLADKYRKDGEAIMRDFLKVAQQHPLKLEESVKRIRDSIKPFQRFTDLVDDYFDEFDIIFDNAHEITTNEYLREQSAVLPGYHWTDVKQEMSVPFADVYFLISAVTTFISTSCVYQFRDVKASQDALKSLVNLLSLSK